MKWVSVVYCGIETITEVFVEELDDVSIPVGVNVEKMSACELIRMYHESWTACEVREVFSVRI